MHRLSVIVCCYNEHSTIRQVIEKTCAVDLGPEWEREVIVVDNASTDGTQEILRGIDDPQVRLIFHDHNMGKGMSVRSGIAAMTGDYMLIQDADLEYDPAEHPRFCRFVLQNNAVAVFGSRVLGNRVITRYWRTYAGNRFLTWLTNVLFGGNLTDVATATKMVRADLAKSLHLTTTDFNLDFELPDKILLAGYEILEIPISYQPRSYEEGKKIGAFDAVRAVATMFRDRLGLSAVLKTDAASGLERSTVYREQS
jgi:dolichol-phosphate mannosyltransferase